MVKELQPPPLASVPQEQEHNGGLMLRVANDVVVSHLRKNGYEFTLSTFIPEARIQSTEVNVCTINIIMFTSLLMQTFI